MRPPPGLPVGLAVRQLHAPVFRSFYLNCKRACRENARYGHDLSPCQIVAEFALFLKLATARSNVVGNGLRQGLEFADHFGNMPVTDHVKATRFRRVVRHFTFSCLDRCHSRTVLDSSRQYKSFYISGRRLFIKTVKYILDRAQGNLPRTATLRHPS